MGSLHLTTVYSLILTISFPYLGTVKDVIFKQPASLHVHTVSMKVNMVNTVHIGQNRKPCEGDHPATSAAIKHTTMMSLVICVVMLSSVKHGAMAQC